MQPGSRAGQTCHSAGPRKLNHQCIAMPIGSVIEDRRNSGGPQPPPEAIRSAHFAQLGASHPSVRGASQQVSPRFVGDKESSVMSFAKIAKILPQCGLATSLVRLYASLRNSPLQTASSQSSREGRNAVTIMMANTMKSAWAIQ